MPRLPHSVSNPRSFAFLPLLMLFLVSGALSFQAPAQEAPFIPTEENSWAVSTEKIVDAESPIDLRKINEPVAGEHGFIRISDDGRGFVRGDGEPIRFWSVHASEDRKNWSQEDHQAYARWLARMGVNLALAGTLLKPEPGQPDINKPDPTQLDYPWKRIAALKEQGIYSELRGAWFHSGFQQDPGIEGYGPKETLYGAIFFEPKLQEAFKSWMRELMTRENPYTGIPLKDEPALAAITFFNEDTLFFYTFGNLKGSPLRIAQEQFAQWAAEKYGSPQEALEAWKGQAAEGDAPDDGRLGFLAWWYASPENTGKLKDPARLVDQTQFLYEVQRDYYLDMAKWMREEIGAKQLFITSVFRPAVPGTMMDVESMLKASMDVVALNSYPGTLQHDGKNRGWQIGPGHQIASTSNTRQPLELPQAARQVSGKPFWITETMWPYPHEYANEGALLSAIYGNVAGITSSSFAGPRDIAYSGESFVFPFGRSKNGPLLKKWNCSEPGQMSPFPGAALIARRGYGVQSQPAVVEHRAPEEIYGLEQPLVVQGADFDPIRDKDDAPLETLKSALPPEAFLMGPVLTKFEGGDDQVAEAVKNFSPDAGTVSSLDGAVKADREQGLVTLDTPEAQVAVGFLKAAGPVQLSDVKITSSNEHLGVAVIALDEKPLAQSGKVLLQLSPRARPTGWDLEPATWESRKAGKVDGWKIVSTGSLPFRAEKVEGSLQLKNSGLTKVTVLDEFGRPKTTQDLSADEGGVLNYDFPPDAFYVIFEK